MKSLPAVPPDPARIDNLLQYILAVAGQEDSIRDRQLGPIHLVKYAYLADLAHTRRHGGDTFTGARWRFHHFGPWEGTVFERIEPALAAVGAERLKLSSPKYDDFIRYSLDDPKLLDALERKLPGEVVSAVRWAIHDFGSDTESLLRHVYLTPPMLRAAPEENLVFEGEHVSAEAVGILLAKTSSATPKPSWKDRKEKQARDAQSRKQIRERLAQRVAQREGTVSPSPRYDHVYFLGLAWLDQLAGPPVEPIEGEAQFSDDIWKSRTRSDPDVS